MLPIQIGKSQQQLTVCLVVLISVMFFPSIGTWDMLIWLDWGNNTERLGLVGGYAANHHEYPPLTSVLLYLSFRLADLFGVHHFYGIKLGFACFLVATGLILGRLFRDDLPAFVFSALLLVYSCLALSYLDIYIVPSLLLAFIAIRAGNLRSGLLWYSLAVMTKYPPLIIAPFLGIYVAAQLWQGSAVRFVRALLQVCWPSLLLVVLLLAIFGQEPLLALRRALLHSDLSANALNFNWVQTRVIQLLFSGRDIVEAWNDDARLLRHPPALAAWLARTLFVLGYTAALVWFWRQSRRLDTLLLACLLGHTAYFLFAIGAHENHYFLSIVLALVLYSTDRQYLPLLINVCLINALNLFAFHSYNGNLPDFWRGLPTNGLQGEQAWMNGGPALDFRLMLACFNVLFFLSLWFAVLRQNRQQD